MKRILHVICLLGCMGIIMTGGWAFAGQIGASDYATERTLPNTGMMMRNAVVPIVDPCSQLPLEFDGGDPTMIDVHFISNGPLFYARGWITNRSSTPMDNDANGGLGVNIKAASSSGQETTICKNAAILKYVSTGIHFPAGMEDFFINLTQNPPKDLIITLDPEHNIDDENINNNTVECTSFFRCDFKNVPCGAYNGGYKGVCAYSGSCGNGQVDHNLGEDCDEGSKGVNGRSIPNYGSKTCTIDCKTKMMIKARSWWWR